VRPPRYIATSLEVITKRALSINGNGWLSASMNEETRKEEQEAAAMRYEIAKYSFIQRTRIR